MHRAYNVHVVALTIDVPVKWVDNLLSHHDVPGCSGGRQGVSRRISDLGLASIAIIRLLGADLGIPLPNAVALVRVAATETGIGPLRSAAGTRIDLPSGFLDELQDRLRDALQAAPRRARGRPPRAR